MNREVKKRKKQFCVLCLVLVLVLGNVMPMSVFAEEYWAAGGNDNVPDSILPGDTIDMDAGGSDTKVYYYDIDGTTLLYNNEEEPNTEDDGYLLTVKSYSDAAFSSDRQMPDEQFKEWKVNDVAVSGGSYSVIKLQAVPYTEAHITYHNVEADEHENPAIYYEGKETIYLSDAEKTGYTFEGWYSDAELTTEVTSISTTQTGDVDLYAKFTVNTYDINYHLDGGTNASGNPTGYTYGTGVASFTDAEKTGYTFEGWYSDAELTNKVTSISTTQTGDVDLYAKFKINEVLPDNTPDAGDNAPVIPLLALMLVSGAGMIAILKKRNAICK